MFHLHASDHSLLLSYWSEGFEVYLFRFISLNLQILLDNRRLLMNILIVLILIASIVPILLIAIAVVNLHHFLFPFVNTGHRLLDRSSYFIGTIENDLQSIILFRMGQLQHFALS